MWYIYCRISRDVAGDGRGVERQEHDCRQFAEKHGLTVADVYVDNDVSAFSGAERPAYQEMMNRLRAGEGDGVICWHVDRLFRRTIELEEIVDLVEKKNIQVRTVHAGDIDVNTAQGRMFARMSATLANYEVDHQIERIRASHVSRARKGVWRGGNYPYGYERGDEKGTIRVVDEEARHVRFMADEVESGSTLMAVARRLNDRGSRTKRGNEWSAITVSKLLKSPVLAGLIQHNGVVVGKAEWDPIIDEDQWHRVNAILNDPKRRTNQGLERKWQGSGVYKCGKCGGNMGMHGYRDRGVTRRQYVCLNCNGVARAQERVDEVVDDVILGYLDQPDNRVEVAARTRVDGVDLAALLDKRRALVARKNNAATMYAAGNIDDGQLLAITAELDSNLKPLDQRIAAARETSPALNLALAGDELRTTWSDLPADKRAAVIDELITVTIMPTPRGRFNPEYIKIEWK